MLRACATCVYRNQACASAHPPTDATCRGWNSAEPTIDGTENARLRAELAEWRKRAETSEAKATQMVQSIDAALAKAEKAEAELGKARTDHESIYAALACECRASRARSEKAENERDEWKACAEVSGSDTDKVGRQRNEARNELVLAKLSYANLERMYLASLDARKAAEKKLNDLLEI